LPRAIYGFIAGAAEDDWTFRANRTAFGDYAFRPHVLADVSVRDQGREMWGHRYAMPVGIAPMGSCGLSWKDGDLELAKAAHQAGAPFILSAVSSVPLERIIEAAPHAWYQSYLPPDHELIGRMLDRLSSAGFGTLVITLDIQANGNRENNVRTGFATPVRLTPRLAWDGIAHPRWLFGVLGRYLLTEFPHYENVGPDRGGNQFARLDTSKYKRPMSAMAWGDIERIRARWKGRLVLKSILHEDDAARARSLGADGIIVSNHGGRQLDGARPTLSALPSILQASRGMPVMIDSGFRRGTDVLKALALGARLVFMGRPMLFGLAAGGQAGAAHALQIVRSEIDRDLALLGCRNLDEVTQDLLVDMRRRP